MVMPLKGQHLQILLLDALGGSIVVLLLGTLAWVATAHRDGAAREVVELEQQVRFSQGQVATLKTNRERKKALVMARREELRQRGKLPSEAPVETYLGQLSELAEAAGMDVLVQSPVAINEYPGLMENQYLCKVAGPAKSLMQFLKAIETSDYWADVGFLDIKRGDPLRAHGPTKLNATLTLSLFSAPPPSEKTKENS